jgi:hypothetical protein
MTNPLYQIDTLPTTDQAAIREFNDRYIAALTAAPASGWVDMFGALVPTNAPLVTFPVTQLRSKFLRTQGENRFKNLRSASFDVKSEEFDDGYWAPLKELFEQTFAYRRWQAAPAALVAAEERFRHQQIAAKLEAGESTAWIDGVNFFSATHPANLFDDGPGTWSNYQVSTKDVVSVANIAAEAAFGHLVKDENGDKLGVQYDTIFCPAEKVEPLKNLLAQALILDDTGAAAVSNPYVGRWRVIVIPEFTDANDWYLVDSKIVGDLSPWIVMRQNMAAPLALRQYDTNTDYFRDTGNIKMSAHIWYGTALALPHAIRKVKGA